MQAGDQIQGMQEDKRRNLRVAATVAIGVGLVVALVTLAHVLQGDSMGASEMISSLVKVASSSAAASPLSHGTSVATGSDKLLKLSRDPRYKAFNERVKKESSSELLKDSQTAEEQLNSEKSYDKMIATQKRGIEGRDAHFQQKVKSLVTAEHLREHQKLMQLKSKKNAIDGYVSSSDAAFESSLKQALQKEKKHSSEYENSYQNAVQSVQTRDKEFTARIRQEIEKERILHAQHARSLVRRERTEGLQVRKALAKIAKEHTTAWQEGELQDHRASKDLDAFGDAEQKRLQRRYAKERMAHDKEVRAQASDILAITGGLSDGVDQNALQSQIAKEHKAEREREQAIYEREIQQRESDIEAITGKPIVHATRHKTSPQVKVVHEVNDEDVHKPPTQAHAAAGPAATAGPAAAAAAAAGPASAFALNTTLGEEATSQAPVAHPANATSSRLHLTSHSVKHPSLSLHAGKQLEQAGVVKADKVSAVKHIPADVKLVSKVITSPAAANAKTPAGEAHH